MRVRVRVEKLKKGGYLREVASGVLLTLVLSFSRKGHLVRQWNAEYCFRYVDLVILTISIWHYLCIYNVRAILISEVFY